MLSRLLAASSSLRERRPSRVRFAARQQGVFLALDEAPVLAAQPGVFGLAHLVERLAEVAHDVELVEQDRGLRRGRRGGVAERLPHVHDGEADLAALLRPQFVVELRQTALRPILAAEPNGASGQQIADDNAVDVALLDRDLVDADHHWRWRAGLRQLRPHVLLLQALHRVPVQPQLARHIPHRGPAAPPSDIHCKPLRVAWIVGQEIQPLQLHAATAPAIHPSRLELQDNPVSAAAQIAHPPLPTVVPAPADLAAVAAATFLSAGRG